MFEPALPSSRRLPIVSLALGPRRPRVKSVIDDEALFKQLMIVGEIHAEAKRQRVQPSGFRRDVMIVRIGAAYNRSERCKPWIAQLKEDFARLDLAGHQMSGSGTSYFGLCRNARQARQAGARLRSLGWSNVYVVNGCL